MDVKVFEQIIQSVTKLIEYTIIFNLNSGDKVFDSLLMGIITILIAIGVTKFKENIIEYYNVFIHLFERNNIKSGLVKNILSKGVDKDKHLYLMLIEYKSQVECFKKWIYERYPELTMIRYNIIKGEIEDINLRNSDLYYPIYQLNNKYIYYKSHTSYTTSLIHLYGKLEDITWFLQLEIKPRLQNINDSNRKVVSEYSSGIINQITTVNPYRTLDTLVFRQKENLQNFISTFEKNIKNVTNMYTPKNLGILLYGPPGTGKTSVLKALANYFNRDIIVLNFSS